MRLVKVSDSFFNECKKRGTESELLYNENGRPSVLLVHLKYKDKIYKFVVPLRSNISGKTPRSQYFSLPPNKNTRSGNSHGVHYIKIFPIKDKYIETYLISEPFDLMIKGILDKNEKTIISACQDYLLQCENGHKHFMTPDIDGILEWLYEPNNNNTNSGNNT